MNQEDDLTALVLPSFLTPLDRVKLANEFLILARLNQADSNEALKYQQLAEIVQRGYSEHYNLIFNEIWPELSSEHQRELNGILAMFRAINGALARVDEATKNQLAADGKYSLTFEGFDLNNTLEGRLLSYMWFLFSMEHWADLMPAAKALPDGGNSHSPRLEQYRKMVTIFRAIQAEMETRTDLPARDQWVLNENDLLRISSGT